MNDLLRADLSCLGGDGSLQQLEVSVTTKPDFHSTSWGFSEPRELCHVAHTACVPQGAFQQKGVWFLHTAWMVVEPAALSCSAVLLTLHLGGIVQSLDLCFPSELSTFPRNWIAGPAATAGVQQDSHPEDCTFKSPGTIYSCILWSPCSSSS